MRNGLPLLAVITALLLFSCKKERSFDLDANGGGNTSGNLLSKTVTHLGGDDSVIVIYNYDNQKRLIAYRYDGISGGSSFSGEIKFERNAQGIIQKMIVKSDELAALGLDSVLYILHNNSSSRFTSGVFIFDDSGITFKDSTAYSYNGSGKIIQSEEFFDDGISGGYAEVSKTEFNYDAAGNVIRAKNYIYDDVAGMYETYDEDIYEYDTKVNPLILGNEAFLLGDPTLAGPNNAIKDIYIYYDDASLNDIITTTYTYNSGNKPVTSSAVYQSEGIPYPTNYTYQ